MSLYSPIKLPCVISLMNDDNASSLEGVDCIIGDVEFYSISFIRPSTGDYSIVGSNGRQVFVAMPYEELSALIQEEHAFNLRVGAKIQAIANSEEQEASGTSMVIPFDAYYVSSVSRI